MGYFEIGETEVFVDISVSPFNCANMSSKYIANLTASNVTLKRCASTMHPCPCRQSYGTVVWCSAADTHLKLQDRVVSGDSFLTGGVFECDLAHRRSVAVFCMLYKIRCNPMYPLYGALPVPYTVCAVSGYTRRCDRT